MDTNSSRRDLPKKQVAVYLRPRVLYAIDKARGWSLKRSEWIERAIRSALDAHDRGWDVRDELDGREKKNSGVVK